MKRHSALFLCLACVAALSSSCVTAKDAGKSIEDLSWELIDYFPKDGDHTVAVYYFTEGGEISPSSEYVINRMTTEIANAIHEESAGIKIVSRGALDRLIQEQAFQVSEFADPDSQLAIGKQLGADLIITGTITRLSGNYEINAQLIDVRTAAVLGGVARSFRMDSEGPKK
jgi:TolB-like protein